MALLLTTSAHAVEEEATWSVSFRKCAIDRSLSDLDKQLSFFAIEPRDIPALERGIVVLKRCKIFWECVARRDEGKVRHCFLRRNGRTVVR